MSWLFFLGYLAMILFLDSHAKRVLLQVRTNLDIFMASALSRSWQDLTCFSMFFEGALIFGSPGSLSGSDQPFLSSGQLELRSLLRSY